MPSSRSRASSSKIWSTTIGASPSDGSSSSSSRGPRHQRAADREHLLLPARERARRSARGARSRIGEELQHVAGRPRLVGAVARDARRRGAGCRRPSAAGRRAGPRARARSRGARSRSGVSRSIARPVEQMQPDAAGTRPTTALSRLDLPAPLAPSRATISPCLDVQRHVLHGHDGAVADDEVVDGEDVHARRQGSQAFAMYFGVKLVRNVNFLPFILTRKTSLVGTRPTGSMVTAPVAIL